MPADFGRILIVIGVIIIFAGIVYSLFGKIPFLGKLPGDILVKRENFTFFAPIGSSILLSIILTILLHLLNKSKL